MAISNLKYTTNQIIFYLTFYTIVPYLQLYNITETTIITNVITLLRLYVITNVNPEISLLSAFLTTKPSGALKYKKNRLEAIFHFTQNCFVVVGDAIALERFLDGLASHPPLQGIKDGERRVPLFG